MAGLVDLFGPFVPVPVVLRLDPRVTAAHALTYGALAACLGVEGAGSVRLRRVVERSWRSAATVRRHLDDLEAWGYLHRKRAPGRPSYYRLDRLVLEQLELELEANPAHLDEHTNPAHLGEHTRPGNPARIVSTTRARKREHTPRTFKDKTGDEENENPKPDPLEVFGHGLGRRFDPHAWDQVTPLGDVIDELSDRPADDA